MSSLLHYPSDTYNAYDSDSSGQNMTMQDIQSGGEVAEQRDRGNTKRLGKADVRYWESKLFHDGYTRDGQRTLSPDWSVRIQHGGRRDTFPLSTPNKANAANKARDIYQCLKGAGWDEALRRFKPDAVKPEILDATVGDFVREAQAVAGIKPKTFADYAKAFRLIVSDVFRINGGAQKFNPHTGGRDRWLEKVGAVKLADLTPERIQKWKLAFLKRAGADPAKQRVAKISVNSLLRQAKSLFSKKVLRFLNLKLPTPLPFHEVEFEPRQSMRFHSVIDVQSLIAAARDEMEGGTAAQREQFKIFLLSLCAGLRRNEIDKLEWSAFDFSKAVIHIQPTEFLAPKTQESCGEIELDPEVAEIFQKLRVTAAGNFIIDSDRQPLLGATYSTYRCKPHFDDLVAWLRKKGISSQKPIHELRKEFGSMIANEHGIFAASRALRHTDVALTNQHYADKKKRVTVGLGLRPTTTD